MKCTTLYFSEVGQFIQFVFFTGNKTSLCSGAGFGCTGNPFGLIEGLADGAKGLFYEPIQGAIQGPEEFAEGLALGLRSLLSGTLGMGFSSIWSNE